jgi:hypothetical protein
VGHDEDVVAGGRLAVPAARVVEQDPSDQTCAVCAAISRKVRENAGLWHDDAGLLATLLADIARPGLVLADVRAVRVDVVVMLLVVRSVATRSPFLETEAAEFERQDHGKHL